MNQERHQQDGESGRIDVTPEGLPPVDSGRRRLFRGVGGGAGVLLAVSAKSAIGGVVCQSPSAALSGNTSPRPGAATCSGGLSPGYWVQPQHAGNWVTAGGVFPTFGGLVVSCDIASAKLKKADIATPGTTLQSLFSGWVPAGTDDPIGMWFAIYDPTNKIFGGGGGIGQLLRHLSCAWLNAGYFTSAAALYPITKAQVIDMWTQLKNTGVYCPSSLSGCSVPWTADKVISYIEGLYDINAPVANLCVKSN
ncbi:MAG: hypothetical protein Q8K96_18555 [Rubrivivax sp.]|nr:hypothetical protein [Rubrivivax sp.]